MKNPLILSAVIFLFVLFVLPVTVAAQASITSGSITTFYVDNAENPPRSIYLGFSVNGGASAFLNNDVRILPPTVIISNRQAVKLTYTVEPSQTARGNIGFGSGGCIDTYLSNPNQPLSTRFVTTFADFRAPKFSKSTSQLNSLVEVITPFTMAGRVSCLDEDGTVRSTQAVSGSGTATLRFKRTRTNPKQALLVGASYAFSIPPSFANKVK